MYLECSGRPMKLCSSVFIDIIHNFVKSCFFSSYPTQNDQNFTTANRDFKAADILQVCVLFCFVLFCFVCFVFFSAHDLFYAVYFGFARSFLGRGSTVKPFI